MAKTPTRDSADKLRELATTHGYTACDISDCLLKLDVPGAGFLADILPLSSFQTTNSSATAALTPPIAVSPISTILFVPKSFSPSTTTATDTASSPPFPPSNIAKDTHWTDLPPPSTITIVQQYQPPSSSSCSAQSCAVVGDILATRLKIRGVKGIVVDGRIRDLTSMSRLSAPGNRDADADDDDDDDDDEEEGGTADGFDVWNRATSTVGSGLEAKAWASEVVLRIGNVIVHPGDILFADRQERGVVVIPHDKLDALLELLPKLKAADDAVIADVLAGVGVQEAFKRHRG